MGIAKWHHMLMMKTIIRLAEHWNIPVTWINGTSDTLEDMSKESSSNLVDDELHIIHHFMAGIGITLTGDPETDLNTMSDMILKPMEDKIPPPGATVEQVSRDLLHPGASVHLALADKVEFELDAFGTLNS